MKDILNHLHQGNTLPRAAAKVVLKDIAAERYNPVQATSFITAYMMRPITLPELQGFRDAFVDLLLPVELENRRTIDIVGTGGDGKDTFNISTCSSFLVAGAGYQVTKHGSYGVSSVSGSSDVLMALGYQPTADRDTLLRQLDKAGICFMHAPLFHPAMKAVVPIRKQLKMRTFFNMLGPLINPAQPDYQLFGTFDLELSRLYKAILDEADKKYSIVYALDGYDEISLTGAFFLRQPEGENLLSPADLGMPKYQQSDLYGGNSIEEAKSIFINILENKGTAAQQDVVIANAGLAIHTMKPSQSLDDCLAEAKLSLASGKALSVLKKLVAA